MRVEFWKVSYLAGIRVVPDGGGSRLPDHHLLLHGTVGAPRDIIPPLLQSSVGVSRRGRPGLLTHLPSGVVAGHHIHSLPPRLGRYHHRVYRWNLPVHNMA